MVYMKFRKQQKWPVLEGTLFILAGILAVIMPNVTALAIEVLIGALLTLLGGWRLWQGFQFEPGRIERRFSGAILLAAGLGMLIWPEAGLRVIVGVIGVLVLIEGVFEILLALGMRPLRIWLLFITAGILNLIIGIAIFVAFPEVGVIYISIALGLSLILYGATTLAMAWHVKKASRPEDSRDIPLEHDEL